MAIKSVQSDITTSCIKVLADSRVIIDPNYIPFHARRNEEDKAKWLEEWANELVSFFHDHRSMDVNSASVERIYKEQCKHCSKDWEPELFEATKDEPSYLGCAWCGAVVNEKD